LHGGDPPPPPLFNAKNQREAFKSKNKYITISCVVDINAFAIGKIGSAHGYYE